MPGEVFISHASKDDAFVKELREALEGHLVTVWVDSRNLRGGNKLKPEIDEAIERARQVIVVLSPNTVNSPWVRKEIAKALEVEKRRAGEGYRVIPILLPGIEPSALALWFDEEPVGVPVALKIGGASEALPNLLAALGERLPADFQPIEGTAQHPVEELILELTDMRIHEEGGKRRARATAQLIYEPADETARTAREVESRRFTFTAPLGVIEGEDLRWYLEEYYLWPIGVFQERAARIEKQLPQWGQDLFQAALASSVAQEALNAWQQAKTDGERRFSVFVDSEPLDGASDAEQAVAREAGSELLSLPWELLHDGRGFLFHGKHAVLVRRRLPNRHQMEVRPTALPIRVLLVSPRPEENNRIGYIDHRISARPLIEAVESLGELVTVTLLEPPTFAALEKALQEAADKKQPFDVIHFDGHGVYNREQGLGALCFEAPNQEAILTERKMESIGAARLAETIREHSIPLVFLEACQSAKTEDDPTASVAAKLLEEGVTSVIAMSHSVLVETARRFVRAFYQELAQGKRVGAAMIAGQRELHRDTARIKVMGAGQLYLHDWFVPVLYQERRDPQLITALLSKDVQQLQAIQRRLSLGELPELPHEFQGRSRELLALERLLHREPYAVVRGQGGAGKTTLAAELARWLVQTRRFRRAAFVSLEQYTDARGVLINIGQQLLPEGKNWHVAPGDDIEEAMKPVERALRDRATIIVLDNLESVLPEISSTKTSEATSSEAGELRDTSHDAVDEIFSLCRKLLDADPATRLIFTSRESLPAPFDNRWRERGLGPLSHTDAIALVGEVMKQGGMIPKAEDPGGDPHEITDLVEAVNCHARALVLLAREVARKGVRATTENLHQLMAEMDKNYPGDRENSLYASVELSLRRLPPETRAQIKPLAVFHGGANINVLMWMQDIDAETVQNIAAQLIDVGLAEDMGYGHLRLDPALPPYLLREISEEEQEETQMRWAEAMGQLTRFLYQQQSKNAELSARLTLLELPNLMTMLQWIQGKATPEGVIDLSDSVERLLANLGRPQALVQATKARQHAARGLSKWSHAQYLTEDANISRLLESGDLPSAYEAAQQLLQRSLAAGEGVYFGADYDIAWAYLRIGKVLQRGGAAEAALSPLAEAQRRFQALTDAGNTSAEGMVSVAITESANCLNDLGRLDKAAAAYEEAIWRKGKLDDQRGVATNKFQLGTVRMLQRRYTEALEIYAEARDFFEKLGEPVSVSTIWHQIGMLHRETGQAEQAERAYRQSLSIAVQQKDLEGEAGSLYELGALYFEMGRLEEAVTLYQQVVDICVKMRNHYREGMTRNALAVTLTKLQRNDEARRELLRAIECNKSYGHAAEPWKPWGILCDLERATGNPQAAAEARQQAIESYLAYRCAGGQSQTTAAQLCAFATQAISQGETNELEQALAQFSGAETTPVSGKLLIPNLQAILHGSRDMALADDPNLDYDDAAELILLLETLNAQ